MTRKKKTKEPESRPEKIFIRVESSLMERAKEYRLRLAQDMPGMNPSQSDAYRILLNKGLEAEGL